MKPISKQNQIERKNAIDELTSTIIEHDHNKIIKILSDAYRDILLSDKFTDKEILLNKGRLVLDLISVISEFGRVEMNICLEHYAED